MFHFFGDFHCLIFARKTKSEKPINGKLICYDCDFKSQSYDLSSQYL